MSADAVARARDLLRRASPEGKLQRHEEIVAQFKEAFGEPDSKVVDYERYQIRVELARLRINGKQLQQAQTYIAEADAELQRLRLKHDPAMLAGKKSLDVQEGRREASAASRR